jgi:hypothetical protein
MGGGKEKKATNQMMAQDRAQNQGEHNQFMGRVNTDWDQARNRNEEMYQSMFGGYKKFADGSGGAQPGMGAPGSGGGGGDPGAGDGRFGEVETSYRDFLKGGGIDKTGFDRFQGHLGEIAQTGGWSPEARANIMGDVGKMRGMVDDPTIANRMRGNGVFDEFAKTGGYSDQDIGNIRSRANSVIPAYYDVARRDAARRGAIQGGYGPGQSALMSRMSREQARGAASTALDTELGIKDKVNSGRQWGASGLTDAERGYQDMRMRALTGASGIEGGMTDSIARNRTGAANMGATNETGMQSHIQQGKMFGTQGLEGMAESAAARSAAASARGAADARWQAEFDREGQQFGLEGMRSLYGMQPGETSMYLGANMAGRGLNMDNQQGQYDARMRNNPQRDWLGTIAGLAGAGAGVMTGAGALGLGRKVRTAT